MYKNNQHIKNAHTNKNDTIIQRVKILWTHVNKFILIINNSNIVI